MNRSSLSSAALVLVPLSLFCGYRQLGEFLTEMPALADVPTVAQLKGVRLGMPARDLRTARPATKLAPYVGLLEVVEGDTVFYWLLTRPGDSERELSGGAAAVAETDPLIQVEIKLYGDRGRAFWESARRAANPIPQSCTRVQYGLRASLGLERGKAPTTLLVLSPRDSGVDALGRHWLKRAAVRVLVTSRPILPIRARTTIPCDSLPDWGPDPP